MIGGLFGFVGLGNVSGSQKTTPLEDLFVLIPLLSTSDFSLLDKIEDCETPVECDFEMSEAAVGVAVCKTGRLMTGLEGTRGRVEDLDMEGFFSSVGEEPDKGRVLVLDSKGMVVAVVNVDGVVNVGLGGGVVTDVEVVGLLAFPASLTSGLTLIASSFLGLSEAGLGGGGGAFLETVFVGEFSFLTVEAELPGPTTAFSTTASCLFLVFSLTLVVALILFKGGAALKAADLPTAFSKSAAFVRRLLSLWLVEAALEAAVVKAVLARPANEEL